jgi:hypothetical protein
MDKFLGVHNLPKLNQKDINNSNWSIKSLEIESGIMNIPKKKDPVFTDESKNMSSVSTLSNLTQDSA